MSDQATGGGVNPSPLRCEHGLTVDGADGEGECQLCDWCPRCATVRRFDREVCSTCGYEWGDEVAAALATGETVNVEDHLEALEARQRVLARVAAAEAAAPALAPAETPEAQGWPFYEARLSIHVRPSKPTDTFGEGGDEMAHARAWTQAPDFVSAVSRLDADLAKNWSYMLSNAALVDVEPSPDVLPPTPKFWDWTMTVPAWLILAILTNLALMVLLLVGGR